MGNPQTGGHLSHLGQPPAISSATASAEAELKVFGQFVHGFLLSIGVVDQAETLATVLNPDRFRSRKYLWPAPPNRFLVVSRTRQL